MPDTYDVLTQYPSTEFLGGTQTRDVMVVGINAKPVGSDAWTVYLEFQIPEKLYTPAQVKAYATGYSGSVREVRELPGVTDMSYMQDVTPGGQLSPGFTVYVESDSGLSGGAFALPFGQLSGDLAAPKVAALVAKLNASEQ